MSTKLRPFYLLVLVGILCFPPHRAKAAVFYPTSFTLANGLQIVVVPNHLAPVVSQMVWYKVGSADENPKKTGLAHYLEHLMFRGTTNLAPGAFSKMIAEQGGSENAFTSYDYTAYFENVAADRLPMIMSLEADRMHNLNITPETAAPELNVVLNERQQRTDNNPEGKFNEKTRRLLMPESPYGIPVIGWKKIIEKFTTDDARKFYAAYYAPNNAVVIISGDVVPEQVMRLAASIYGAVPRRDLTERQALPDTGTPKQKEFTMTDIGVDQPQVQIGYVVPSYSTQKDKEAYAFEVLSDALDSGEVGVLYKALSIERSLASGVGIGYDPDTRGDTVFTIAATPRPGVNPQKLQTAMQDELAKLAKVGLDAKTVADAKERLQRSAIFARDSLMMPGYAFGMALTTGHSVNDVEAWPDRLASVSVEEVNAALHKLVGDQKVLAAILQPDKHASRAAREAAHPVLDHNAGIR